MYKFVRSEFKSGAECGYKPAESLNSAPKT